MILITTRQVHIDTKQKKQIRTLQKITWSYTKQAFNHVMNDVAHHRCHQWPHPNKQTMNDLYDVHNPPPWQSQKDQWLS